MKRTILIAFLAMGCGNSTTNTGDGGNSGDTGTNNGNCAHINVCDIVTLASVNSACGTMSTMTTKVMSDGAGGNQIRTSDTCKYASAMGTDVTAARLCFDPSGATKHYDDARAQMSPGDTKTDITGVGDKAFVTTGPTQVNVNAIKGGTVVELQFFGVTNPMKAQMCLTSLAQTLITK